MNYLTSEVIQNNYTLKLAQLNEVPLGFLEFVEDFTYSPNYLGISELTFKLRKFYTTETGEIRTVPHYNSLDSDMLLYVNEDNCFYINECTETFSEAEVSKTVHAYGRQYELSYKNFNNYAPVEGRFLYYKHPSAGVTGFPWATLAEIPTTNNLNEVLVGDVDKDGYQFGIFNEIERFTSWRLERDSNGLPVIPATNEDPPLSKQVRLITTSETNLLELLKQIQEAWNILFVFDTINKVISIKPLISLDLNPIGIITDESFVNTLTRSYQRQEIKTRLYIFNKDGDGVLAQRMAHGHPYLENYSYFKKLKYMSQTLIDALNAYEANLASKQPMVETLWAEWKTLLDEYKLTQTKLDELDKLMIAPTLQRESLISIREGIIINEGTPEEERLTEPRELSPEEQALLDELEDTIIAIQKQIEYYQVGNKTVRPRSIETLRKLLKEKDGELLNLQKQTIMTEFFPARETALGLPAGSLMAEMEPFIREGTYQSETILDAKELHNMGKGLLARISKPSLAFTMGLVDFLTRVETQEAWSLASLGKVLRVKNEKTGFYEDVFLTKYTHSPDSNSLTFEFTNNLRKNDDLTRIAEMLAKATSVASNVAYNSSYWSSGGAVGEGLVSGNLGVFSMIQAKSIQTERLVANEIETAKAIIAELYATKANIGELVAASIDAQTIITDALAAHFLKADFANIDFAIMNDLTTDTLITKILEADAITARIVTAAALQAESASIRNLFTDYLTATQINAQYANIDLANIDVGVIKSVLAADLLATDGYIANLKVGDAEIVSLDAAKIIAGTISAEKILLRGTGPNGEQGLLLGLNNLGELVSTNVDSLDGYVLTNNTVHADKIIAESITAREIAANTITADKLLAGTITAASAAIASLDASKLTVGTLDASKVAIANLSATSIKTGLLESINGAFSLDMTTGDFNLGGALIKNGDNVSIIAGGVPIEEYVDGKMLYLIKSNPEQIFINSIHDGGIEDSQSFSLDFSVYKGTALKAATITGVHLQDALGQVISTAGFSYSVIHPTEGGLGKLNLTFGTGTNLPADTGYVQCLITVTENSKQFFYKISWSKVKAPAKQYRIEVISTNGEIFKNNLIVTTLKAFVYEDNLDITNSLPASRFQWTKTLKNGALDVAWNTIYASGYKEIPVTASDISERATFSCSII